MTYPMGHPIPNAMGDSKRQRQREGRGNANVTNLSHPVPATASERVAAESVRQMDELALIGYPILSLEQRAVYATTIRLVAERVIES